MAPIKLRGHIRLALACHYRHTTVRPSHVSVWIVSCFIQAKPQIQDFFLNERCYLLVIWKALLMGEMFPQFPLNVNLRLIIMMLRFPGSWELVPAPDLQLQSVADPGIHEGSAARLLPSPPVPWLGHWGSPSEPDLCLCIYNKHHT